MLLCVEKVHRKKIKNEGKKTTKTPHSADPARGSYRKKIKNEGKKTTKTPHSADPARGL